MQITEIPCDRCKNGLVVNQFTNELVDCSECDGNGVLHPCDSFNTGGQTTIFRNTRCISCGVTNVSHVIVAKLRSMS